MPSYLTFAEYSARSRIRASLITQAGSAKVEAWLAEHSATIRDRLVKRYAVDFTDPGPVPDTICKWLTAFVDHDVQEYIGGNPEGREDEWISKRVEKAEAQLMEAADSEKGLIELPFRNTNPLGDSAINKGGPHVESFTTIYGWFDAQAAMRDGGGW